MAKVEIEESDLQELNAGLKTLMAQAEQDAQKIQDIETDLLIMYKCCAGILGVVGLSDGKKINPDTFQQEGIYGRLAKGGGSLITLMMQSKVPGIGASAKREIDEKFSFLKHMIPVLHKWNPVFQDMKMPAFEEIENEKKLSAPAEPIKLNEP